MLFDPHSSSSETDARARATALAEATSRDRKVFSTTASIERIRWSDGQGDPALTSIVETMDIGQSLHEPVRLHNSFAVVERVEPETICPSPKSQFELPAPSWVDISGLIRRSSPESLARAVADLRSAIERAKLAPNDASETRKAIDHFSSDLANASSPNDSVAAYGREIDLLRRHLSEASYAAIVTGIEEWLAGRLLNPPDSMRAP